MGYIPNILMKVEETLVTYISSSLSVSGSGVILPADIAFYKGMSGEDKTGPAIYVACNSSNEVYFGTRVYEFDVEIVTRTIAYDSTTEDYSDIGGEVYSLFGDSNTARNAINVSASNFRVIQIQLQGHRNERVEDSWASTLSLKVIGALTP